MSLVDGCWFAVKQTDPRVVALYRDHYSSLKKPSEVYRRHGITGPADTLTMLTRDGSAGWLWTKQEQRDDGQRGVNCAFFHRTAHCPWLASELVREADELAWGMWPGARHFTFVDPKKTRKKRDPGRCFRKAGWRPCGTSKGGLVILERLPDDGEGGV